MVRDFDLIDPSERTAIRWVEINISKAYGGNIWDLGCGLW